jgi:2-polyprenyl-3-methyl-5-hydroxy-6-metoxy-1,4-benzoquinol methylase
MKLHDSKVKESSFACLVCGSEQHRFVGRKNQVDLWKCLHCQTIFTGDRALQEDLKELYDHYYDGAGFEIHPVVAHSLERVVFSFERFRITSKILDIGFGEGGLLQMTERQGWQCYGTEISPRSLEYGKKQGWAVTDNAEHDSRFTPQSFDVVTMIELLEHVPNPQQILQSAARWLRPGGLLYLTTPNARSLNQRVLGLEWSVVSPPEHLAIWTPKGLRHALAKSGFQDLRIRTEGLNPYEMLAHWRSQKEAVNRNQTGTALNQAFSSSPARRALKTGINHLLTVFQLGDGLKVYATRGQ